MTHNVGKKKRGDRDHRAAGFPGSERLKVAKAKLIRVRACF